MLSTKDGERFVEDQVESILAQTQQGDIYWRDDGSTDRTIAIMQRLGVVGPLGSLPLGVTPSYARLLRMAVEDGHDYFALADQDDVWHPDKLERAVKALDGITEPALYCARLTIVDATLKRIGASASFREPIGFPASLTQNIAAGCTIVINRSAADLLKKTWFNQPYHDWWCYVLVSAVGGRVITDPNEVLLYRQHAANLIGAPSGYLQRAMAALRRGRHAFMEVFRFHVATLDQIAELLPEQSRRQVAMLRDALAGSKRDRWRALRLPGFHRQTLREDLLFRLWFLLG